MSYDLRFAVKADIAGEDRYVEFKYATLSNPTYNLGDMFRACTGWDFKQSEFYKCSDVIDKVKHGAQELRNHASKYRKYEPSNGWGTISDAIEVLESLWNDMHRFSEWYDIPLDYMYVAW